MGITIVLKDLEKIAPERIGFLKQKQAETMKNLPPELKRMQQRESLFYERFFRRSGNFRLFFYKKERGSQDLT